VGFFYGDAYNSGMEIRKPQNYKARVSEKYYLTENKKYLLVKFELMNPSTMEFRAGQYISIKVSEAGERRSYSIASTPEVSHGVTIVAEMIPKGKGSDFLRMVEAGREVEILGPLGQFVIREGGEKRLFVATGSGIVPLYSMINDLLINRGEKKPIRLHWGMRNEQDLFWFDNFLRLAEEHPNFVFDQVLSKPSEEWSLCTGHVQECLRRDFEDESLDEWEAYVCGSPVVVGEIRAELERQGMPPDKIYQEKFV